jgi:zinc and cadmium transporter
MWPVLAAIVASAAALVGAALILALGDRAQRAAVWLLAYAIGTLLGAATLSMMPEALATGESARAMALFLAGMMGFLVLERAIRWRHPHAPHHADAAHDAVSRPTAVVLLWGDALHNLIDGFVLGASFAVSTEMGIAAALAVFVHEVPQEIGDFAILLSSGMSTRRALALNYLSAITPLPAALVAYQWSSSTPAVVPWLLPIAAGGFIYIALADLVPALHHRRGLLAGLVQVSLIAFGIGTIWAMTGGHARH